MYASIFFRNLNTSLIISELELELVQINGQAL